MHFLRSLYQAGVQRDLSRPAHTTPGNHDSYSAYPVLFDASSRGTPRRARLAERPANLGCWLGLEPIDLRALQRSMVDVGSSSLAVRCVDADVEGHLQTFEKRRRAHPS